MHGDIAIDDIRIYSGQCESKVFLFRKVQNLDWCSWKYDVYNM